MLTYNIILQLLPSNGAEDGAFVFHYSVLSLIPSSFEICANCINGISLAIISQFNYNDTIIYEKIQLYVKQNQFSSYAYLKHINYPKYSEFLHLYKLLE